MEVYWCMAYEDEKVKGGASAPFDTYHHHPTKPPCRSLISKEREKESSKISKVLIIMTLSL